MMQTNTKTAIAGMLVAMGASILSLPAEAVQVVDLRLNDVTTIMVGRAELTGTVEERNGPRERRLLAGFYAPDVTATFTVNAPKTNDYAVGVVFCSSEVETMEIACGDSVLTVDSMPKTWDGFPNYWRQEVPGLLHLKKGENRITFRLPNVQPRKPERNVWIEAWEPLPQDEFSLCSIELGTPAARKAQAERARATKGDADWMVQGKYGLFVHWSANQPGFYNPEKRAHWFQESVKMFDVQHFADQVERTGAAWVTFTAVHQGFYWPAPSRAVDAVMPGRTSERDLLGEIIDALDQRGIKTLFYFHSGYNGAEWKQWRTAVGADYSLVNSSKFTDNIEAIYRECSLRYGKKLKGFGYIDGCLIHDYPLDPHWESWANAIRAGNPDAVVGFSQNLGPTVSIFRDLTVMDSHAQLGRPTLDQVGPGLQYGDVTPAWWIAMDGWLAKEPMNGKWTKGPVHTEREYVDYFVEMAEAGIPVTINMLMTSEVTADHPIFNPKSMAVMEAIRKAVRGEYGSEPVKLLEHE